MFLTLVVSADQGLRQRLVWAHSNVVVQCDGDKASLFPIYFWVATVVLKKKQKGT